MSALPMPDNEGELQALTDPTQQPPPTVWSRRNVRWTVLGAGGLLLILAAIVTIRAISLNPYWVETTDIGIYITAARAMLQGESPYTQATIAEGLRFGYVYPPMLALILTIPISIFGDTATRWLWSGATALAFATSLVLLLRNFGPPVSWPLVILILGIAFNTRAVRVNVYHGQLDPFLLVLFIIGLQLLRANRLVGAGFATGTMIVVKPFLGIVAVWLFLAGAIAVSALSVVIAGALFALSFVPTLGHGLEVFGGWLQASRYATSLPFVAFLDNHSLNGLYARAFSETQFAEPWIVSSYAWPVLSAVTLAALAAIVVVTVPRWTVRRSLAAEDGLILLVEASIILALIMSFGPLMEGNHLLFFLPAAIGSFRLAWLERGRGTRIWTPAAVVWGLFIVVNLSPVLALVSTNPGLVPEHVGGIALLWTWRVGALVLIAALLSARALRHHHARVDGALHASPIAPEPLSV